MASNINIIQTADIDYEDIRQGLKEYLRSDPNFTDYDFDGSAISTLIDILSYVTHINAINANIGLNETFLNTAQFRGSVVGHAQMLSYVPRSCSAPVAFLDVEVKNYDPNKDYVIPRGYNFKTSLGGTTYRYVTLSEHRINRSNGVFENVKIVEGYIQTVEFLFDVRANQRFTLPDEDVDINTMRVTVSPNRLSNEKEVFTRAGLLPELRGGSSIYFIEENPEQLYNIYFGDGVIGKALEDGNLIRVEYVVTQKAESNGAKTFALSEPIRAEGDTENTSIKLHVLSPSKGGGEREPVESVRVNAPITFASQNRAVTPTDFESVIKNNFWNIRDVNAWGGEDHDPPVYGKVFVSILPKTASILTDVERREVLDSVLKPKRVATITPELVDPEFLFIRLEVFFKYDPTITNLTVNELSHKIKQRIEQYSQNDLYGFGKVFRYSNFVKLIDSTDPSILSSVVRVFLQKRFVPNINIPTRYELNYSADLIRDVSRPVIERCTEFTYLGIERCRFADRVSTTGQRVIDVVQGFGKSFRVIQKNVGSVERRRIIIKSFAPQAYQGSNIMIEVVPNSNDVAASFNNVMMIDVDSDRFLIRGDVDSIQAGRDFSGDQYSTTPRIRPPRSS